MQCSLVGVWIVCLRMEREIGGEGEGMEREIGRGRKEGVVGCDEIEWRHGYFKHWIDKKGV